LRFVKEKGIRLENIGAEDIFGGNLKIVMGFIWMLILRFQVEDITEGELRAKDALLLWCQNKTRRYDNVNVQDFHRSWQDGLAFCALIHAHRPNLIDYNSLSSADPYTNLRIAFDVAEEHLGVARLLDPEDIVETAKPDEKSIIAYVSALYKIFATDKATEDAERRVRQLVEFMNMIESLKGEYDGLASDLLNWIKNKIPYMTSREYDGTLQHIQQLVEELKDYRSGEKPDKEKEKIELESLLASINLKLKNSGRNAWTPSEELTIENLNHLWDTLREEELERDKWLQSELNRQSKLSQFKNRFEDKASQLEKWIAEKDSYLEKVENVQSLSDATNKLNRAQAFTKEYDLSKQRLEQVQKLGQEIIDLQDPESDQVRARVDKITHDWNSLEGKHAAKVRDLEQKLEREILKEDLRKQWAREAQDFVNWAKKAVNEVSDREFGNSLEEVEAFKDKLDESDAGIHKGVADKHHVLHDLWSKLQELGVTVNPYSPFKLSDIEASTNNLNGELDKRRVAYHEELERQREMEEKRKEFAKLAQDFVEHVDSKKK
jgi:actinin alpha